GAARGSVPPAAAPGVQAGDRVAARPLGRAPQRSRGRQGPRPTAPRSTNPRWGWRAGSCRPRNDGRRPAAPARAGMTGRVWADASSARTRLRGLCVFGREILVGGRRGGLRLELGVDRGELELEHLAPNVGGGRLDLAGGLLLLDRVRTGR